jgi:hypothetical protein
MLQVHSWNIEINVCYHWYIFLRAGATITVQHADIYHLLGDSIVSTPTSIFSITLILSLQTLNLVQNRKTSTCIFLIGDNDINKYFK